MEAPDEIDPEIKQKLSQRREDERQNIIWRLEQHPEINEARRFDRAQVWLLSAGELCALGSDFERIIENCNRITDLPIVEQRPYLDRITRLLHELYSQTK